MGAIGRPKEAQCLYKEGRSVAQFDTQCSQLYAFVTGWPMTYPCASILRPRRCMCLPPASFERPVSDRPPRRPLCDMLKTSRRPWRSWRGLHVLCVTLERPRQPFGLLSVINGDLASFVVVQGRHKSRSPCLKGVLPTIKFYRFFIFSASVKRYLATNGLHKTSICQDRKWLDALPVQTH